MAIPRQIDTAPTIEQAQRQAHCRGQQVAQCRGAAEFFGGLEQYIQAPGFFALGTKGPGPLERQGDLVGQGLHHKHVGLVEAPYLATLHVQHANQALTKADRHSQLAAGVRVVFDIMNVVVHIVDQ